MSRATLTTNEYRRIQMLSRYRRGSEYIKSAARIETSESLSFVCSLVDTVAWGSNFRCPLSALVLIELRCASALQNYYFVGKLYRYVTMNRGLSRGFSRYSSSRNKSLDYFI